MNIADEFLKHAHFVDKRANQLSRDMLIELNKAHSSITGKLATIQADVLNKPFLKASYARRKKVLTMQAQAIENIITDIFKEINVIIEDAAQDTLFGTAQATHGIISKAAPTINVDFTKLHLPVAKKWFETTTIAGLLPNELINKLEASTRDKIISVSRQALIQGKGTLSMARMLKKQGIEGTYRGIEGLSRTLLLSASNYAKDELITENYSDVVKQWRYLATLDGRTCLVCGADDHSLFKLNEYKPVLPQHFNCRCTYVPVVENSIATGQRPTGKHSERWVQHRDGTRSRKFTPDKVSHHIGFTGSYQAWLKEQLKTDPAFVKDILGPKRFELFSKGKLNLKAMVTDGRIKNLKKTM
ncbi:phage minor head protein [Desulfobacula sp.]|uniref:phage minor head protein n=1 Tax=Desulfobacula sp. TaxID=2593537 RepID=UPI00261545EE|nr:phage minor head protein [Desulfobacula sp.]